MTAIQYEIDRLTDYSGGKMIKEIVEFMGEYRLTGNRKHETRDGYAWHANILRNGQKIGEVDDAGHGGSITLYITDPAESKALRDFSVFRSKEKDPFEPEGSFLAACADYEEMLSKIRKNCKNKTLYRLSEDTSTDYNGIHFEYRASKTPFSDNIRSAMQKQFGARLVEIINDEIDNVPVAKAATRKTAKKSP